MGDKVRVVLLDEDRGSRGIIENYLREYGYKVYSFSIDEENIDEVNPSIIIIKIKEEEDSSLKDIKRISNISPGVPILVISNSPLSTSFIVSAVKCGASDFITMPLNSIILKKALDKLLNTPTESPVIKKDTTDPYTLLFNSKSDKLRSVKMIIDQVASTDITVLIRGESGTGKGVAARAIHLKSKRNKNTFITVNCAALPEELLESELFGYEKGAFTGAQKRKPGKFEFANEGTIFLDEISEMSPSLQAKFLQVLQDGEFSRLGGNEEISVNTRVIAATNRDLEKLVKEGKFREDLFYRLNVVNIFLPPLRSRKEDIIPLTNYFIEKYNIQYNRDFPGFSNDLIKLFLDYDWPGNVRELENLVKRAVVLGDENVLYNELKTPKRFKEKEEEIVEYKEKEEEKKIEKLDEIEIPNVDINNMERISLKDIAREAARKAERDVIYKVLQKTRWNRKESAEILQISYKALLYKIKECGLDDNAI